MYISNDLIEASTISKCIPVIIRLLTVADVADLFPTRRAAAVPHFSEERFIPHRTSARCRNSKIPIAQCVHNSNTHWSITSLLASLDSMLLNLPYL